MVEECVFLEDLYSEFAYSGDEEKEKVATFIDKAAIWSTRNSSYRVRKKLQEQIKCFLKLSYSKTEIRYWIFAFEKLEDYIKACEKERKRERYGVDVAND